MSTERPAYRFEELGVIIVDHGSRRDEANAMLLDVVAMFERLRQYKIVEPAHMELAEPSIATAFDRCVERGARLVVVHPYFLLPGRHWKDDIPRLSAEAAQRHPGVRFVVTAPLGLHPLMADVMEARIQHCLSRVLGEADACELCAEDSGCRLEPPR